MRSLSIPSWPWSVSQFLPDLPVLPAKALESVLCPHDYSTSNGPEPTANQLSPDGAGSSIFREKALLPMLLHAGDQPLQLARLDALEDLVILVIALVRAKRAGGPCRHRLPLASHGQTRLLPRGVGTQEFACAFPASRFVLPACALCSITAALPEKQCSSHSA